MQTQLICFTSWRDASMYKYLAGNHFEEVDQLMADAYGEAQDTDFLKGFFSSPEEEEDEKYDLFSELAATSLEKFCQKLVRDGFDTMDIGVPSLDEVCFHSVAFGLNVEVDPSDVRSYTSVDGF